VVAEGVETLEQLTFLKDNACKEIQGFYFYRPITAQEVAEVLPKQ
jgi:EAL domain-containing protein (putative c-di-GMP-specific phosphodiesterase class I)